MNLDIIVELWMYLYESTGFRMISNTSHHHDVRNAKADFAMREYSAHTEIKHCNIPFNISMSFDFCCFFFPRSFDRAPIFPHLVGSPLFLGTAFAPSPASPPQRSMMRLV